MTIKQFDFIKNKHIETSVSFAKEKDDRFVLTLKCSGQPITLYTWKQTGADLLESTGLERTQLKEWMGQQKHIEAFPFRPDVSKKLPQIQGFSFWKQGEYGQSLEQLVAADVY